MDQTAVMSQSGAGTLTLQGARLYVVRGADKGRAARIASEELVVGTSDAADLQLTDPTISRSHMVLRVTPRGYLVTDLGSTNGTRLEGKRIVSAYVSFGDKLQVGETTLRLEIQKQRVDLQLSPQERFGRLVGRSVALRRTFALLEQAAPSDATVLLTGESGTGKDAAAVALHEASARSQGPFVVVDCSTLVGSLMESELFGHVRGAFTGAHGNHPGAFVEAHGGTLFLDEIGELPRDLQPKLLRALENRQVRPLGAGAPLAVDVRIIAATNRDLRREVNQGLFREDLFYRLHVVEIRMPPLRERPEDIPLLADLFWREAEGPGGACPEEWLASLTAHDWPGNVRELRNRIQRGALFNQIDVSQGDRATPAPSGANYHLAKAAVVEAFERTFLGELMRRADGNVTEAARAASMDRVYLTRLLKKYRMKR